MNIKRMVDLVIIFIGTMLIAHYVCAQGIPYEMPPIKVAVIDTGFSFKSTWLDKDGKPKIAIPKICSEGHFDYANDSKSPLYGVDTHGHGTHIAGLIAQNAGNSNYCLVILKYYDPSNRGSDNMYNSSRAIRDAINLNVDIINYSGGGLDKSDNECALVKEALDKGIVIVAAAGNEGSKLEDRPYYPAMCDSRVVVVTNLNRSNHVMINSSNRSSTGSIPTFNDYGVNLKSTLPNNEIGLMTGTSQATAAMTGKMIRIIEIMKVKKVNTVKEFYEPRKLREVKPKIRTHNKSTQK